MKSIDLQKQTATVSSTATINLGAALDGCRTLAQVIAAGELVVGEKGLALFVRNNTTGAFESGLYTVTNETTVTRERITSSSNNGQPVAFGGATVDVYSASPGYMLNAGLTNPDNPGFDIVLCAGQSNMLGLGDVFALTDFADPRVYQFASNASDTNTYQKIVAADPLKFPYDTGAGLSPATWFSKTYEGSIPSNRKVLLVPIAQGGQALVFADYGKPVAWAPGNPGGDLYEKAISQTNAALAAARAMYPNSRVVGTIWIQGETDGDFNVSTSQYVSALKALISGFRSRITDAANSWFVIGGMVPERVNIGAQYAAIQAAHIQVASETRGCYFVPGTPGHQRGDNLHYDGQGARIMGAFMGAAVPKAIAYSGVDNIAPTAVSAAVSGGAPTVVTLTMSEPLNASFVPAASAFTIAGHAVSSVAVSGSAIALTCSPAFASGESRTVSYTQPATNGARDIAGNFLASFSTLAITNSVPAPDVTAPAFVSAAVANATPAIIQITMNEALAGSAPPASAFTVSGGKTVNSVSMSGAVLSLTCSSAYVNGDAISVTYTKPGTNPIQDAAGNQTAGFGPVSVTNNVAAVSTATPLRFGNMTDFLETSSTVPYAYQGQVGYTGQPMGATSLLTMAGDGQVTIQIGNGQGKPMLTAKRNSVISSYGGLPYVLFANDSGYGMFGDNGTPGATNITPAAGDLMRLTRTGTTLVASVSKNGGSTWTTIYTWTGVSVTLWIQILAEAGGTLVNPVGVGFA